jgi:hypothetical protein
VRKVLKGGIFAVFFLAGPCRLLLLLLLLLVLLSPGQRRPSRLWCTSSAAKAAAFHRELLSK